MLQMQGNAETAAMVFVAMVFVAMALSKRGHAVPQ
jgi:hypothetical protein